MKRHRKTTSPVVYFLRGLVSRGDEALRLGPLELGTYSGRLLRALHQVTVINVEGLGRGTAEEMGERACQFLLKDAVFTSLKEPVHLLGHSLGGLVARCLAHRVELEGRIASVVTLGTPHQGIAAAVPRDHGRAMKLIRNIADGGFEDRSRYYVSCRPESLVTFNRRYPDVEGIFYASALGVVPRARLPFVFQVVDGQYNDGPSDGLVPEASQQWGQSLGQFRLDHLEQIGFCQDLHPLKRLEFTLEFRRLCGTLTDYWHSFPQNH
jgi:pimeloyl-ACP methyl ester carboxylesterase